MLPLHTTTISVQRPSAGDAFDTTVYTTVASGVRAHIGAVGGSELVGNGSSQTLNARLDCAVTILRHGDRIVDATTGYTWQVTWAALRYGLGLDHVEADLLAVTDRAVA